MRRSLVMLAGCLLLGACLPVDARQLPGSFSAAAEEQLENNTAADDSRWQQLNAHTRFKVTLNTADAATLQSLGMLTPLQISALLAYRQLLGPLVSIYELQAVPGFDQELIHRLLPYVTVGNDLKPSYTLRDYLHKGEHALLLRYGRQLETARGYKRVDSLPPHYAGTPGQLLLRCRYSFPRYASWGVTMEKDAGEQFFKGAQKQGFDFYSVHFFIRNYRRIKALALGDFTVNMGQGLINWQSLAFGKSSLVMQVKREGEVLHPYVSTGESNFFRGAGITLQQQVWQVTAFVSLRYLDGNTGSDDSLAAVSYISSFVTTGLHRSVAEAAKRGAVQQISAGGNVVYDNDHWRIGINVIQHYFSPSLKKGVQPYQLFAPEGEQFRNISLDYSGNWKQVHAFGEVAADAGGNIAFLGGLLTSVAPRADVALLYRNYSRAYQSLYSNAFGNNARPVNERGWYTAITLRITPQLKWEGYTDLFSFPWLKYRIHAPAAGREQLMALTYTPARQTEVFIRYRYSTGWENETATNRYIAPLVQVARHSLRWQVSLPLSAQWKFRSRVELNNYRKAGVKQQGWLCYQELQYRCPFLSLRMSGRLTWFSTSGTGSTVYAMESSMLYNYGVQQLSGEGWSYNVNLKWPVARRLSAWLRWSQVLYRNATLTGSGWEQLEGSQKSDIQLQIQQLF